MTSIELLTGHTTVQASAGSGKTHLLISRIVRLLLTGAEAGNILAITFTRKAANEMQTRLLERLFELATYHESDLIKIINDLQLDANPTVISRCRGLYEKILRNDAPVKTSTFHAFCQELLRRFPMEANISPGFDLLDTTNLLYDEAWDALMAEANLNRDKPLAESLQLLFKELGLYNSKQALRNFLEHRSDWWAYTWNEDKPVLYAQQCLKKQLNILKQTDPVADLFSDENTLNLLNEFHILLCKHNTATNKKHSDLIYKVINKDIHSTVRFNLFKECFLVQTGAARQRKESKAQDKSMGPEGQERFIELHIFLSNKLIEVNAQLAAIRTMETSSAWYLAGQHYLAHFQKLKKEQRLLDFTDLEWQTYLLLNQSNNALWVQYKLDQRVDHLLVDEFQDTNPTQWRLILPLLEEISASTDERNRSVFIVGDEKQSIYRFRRAEPRLFYAAKEWLSKNLAATTCPLSHSWRSSPAVIKFVNKIFTQKEFQTLLPGFIEHHTYRDKLAGKVTLLPLSLKELVEKEDTEDTPVVLRNPLDEPRPESISQQYFNEGLMIAEQIKYLVDSNTAIVQKNGNAAVNYNDIIILLRSRTHVAEYERALREKGIPYIGANRGTLLESLEVIDMLDLLQWLILPFDNLSLAGILRSPIFSISNDDLIAIKQTSKGSWFERLANIAQQQPEHKSLPRAYQLLTQWQEDASKLPVHDLLDKIYSEANVLARYVAAFPSHLSPRVTANLNRFLELALEMDSGRYPSLTRFSSWLNELRQMENEAPDEPVTSSSDESEQRVKILSIHAAKGLEAPVIFLADSASSPANKKAYSTLIDWPAEKEKPEYFLLTATKNSLDDFSKKCIDEQDFFERREDANLLYVALTRAKQMLFISGSEPKSKEHGWYEMICSAFNFSSKDNTDAVILEKDGNEEKATRIKQQNTKNNAVIPKELSSIIKIQNQNIDISPSQQVSSFSQNTESNEGNTTRGIIMHQMLNFLSRYPDGQLSNFYSIEIKETEKTEIDSWWDECKSIIQNETFSDYFSTDKYDKSYNEVPIQFKDKGRNVYGIIDRLIIKDNNVTIIDYKTHPYVTKENIETIAQTYSNQMQLYQNGVQLLWPDYNVKSTLLFTAIAHHYFF
ncbi:MAG: UvrD-helicase domain-containing protein [Gammaproteobacteria bacterium]|nr:UvrD-helicase domain-containing protein [Gammaproteobacteria bacterium]MCW8986337.1 UvrD-helicase domain-containing protein [Gammaproteobacteria bacterium]